MVLTSDGRWRVSGQHVEIWAWFSASRNQMCHLERQVRIQACLICIQGASRTKEQIYSFPCVQLPCHDLEASAYDRRAWEHLIVRNLVHAESARRLRSKLAMYAKRHRTANTVLRSVDKQQSERPRCPQHRSMLWYHASSRSCAPVQIQPDTLSWGYERWMKGAEFDGRISRKELRSAKKSG